jgi:hypothetical protein
LHPSLYRSSCWRETIKKEKRKYQNQNQNFFLIIIVSLSYQLFVHHCKRKENVEIRRLMPILRQSSFKFAKKSSIE